MAFLQETTESRETIFSDDSSYYHDRFVDNETFTSKEGLNYVEGGGRQRSLSRNMEQQTFVET